VIEPEDKPRKKALFTTPVEPSVVEMLRVYCEFLNSSQHHGVAQFLRCAFGRDKEFHAWVNQHPTLRNAITAFIPDEDRLVFIEDTAEIQVDKPNIVGFEARREQPDLPAVTIRDLVRGALRHRPDRIILGEVRSGEAFDLLQTLNRLATCMLEGGVELPYAALRSAIADSIQLVMQIARRDGRPTVNELLHRRSGGVIQRIVEAEEIASDETLQWLARKNGEGFEVYVGMNALKAEAQGRTKADIADIRHLSLDLDRDAEAALSGLQARDDTPEPNRVLDTSPGKLQVVWKVDRFTLDGAESLQRRLAGEFGADLAATDAARVLRLPGFLNHKYESPHAVAVRALSERTTNQRTFAVSGSGLRLIWWDVRHLLQAESVRATSRSDLHPRTGTEKLVTALREGERRWERRRDRGSSAGSSS
jgi:hypothetical protein